MNVFVRQWKALAAVVAVAVIATAVVGLDRRRAEFEPLLAAADQLQRETALFDLTASAKIQLSFPGLEGILGDIEGDQGIVPPSFPPGFGEDLPQGFQDAFSQEFDDAFADFGEVPDLGGLFGDMFPSELDVETSIEAEGALALPDRFRMVGDITATAAGLGESEMEMTEFGVIMTGDEVFFSPGDDVWIEGPSLNGEELPDDFTFDMITDFIREGDVIDQGTESIGGVLTRHYSLVSEPEDIGNGGEVHVTSDFWVGGDDRLRRFHASVTGSLSNVGAEGDRAGISGSFDLGVRIDLHSFGVDVSIERPANVVEGGLAGLVPFSEDFSFAS